MQPNALFLCYSGNFDTADEMKKLDNKEGESLTQLLPTKTVWIFATNNTMSYMQMGQNSDLMAIIWINDFIYTFIPH